MLWFNFILPVNFIFLFFSMVICQNAVETKGNKSLSQR